jgi:hypothetical protein
MAENKREKEEFLHGTSNGLSSNRKTFAAVNM